MAFQEGDRVMVRHHDTTRKVGKATVLESPAYHGNHRLAKYIRVKITHPLEKSLPKGIEMMVKSSNCRRLVPKTPDA